MKQLADNLIDAMRGNPLALALVVVNLLFLLAFGYIFREISNSIERRDKVIAQLADCVRRQ
jgi:p-aminobenzoyl-glutamate transporter AbgT